MSITTFIAMTVLSSVVSAQPMAKTTATATTATAARPAPLAPLAIVTQNQTPLRAAPRDSAPQQAVLWQGDLLEIRGRRMDYLQVYDHRRERAGYVKATQARAISPAPDDAPELLSVIRFLRDTPGAEALGIGYGAAYLRAVPARTITAESFDALGVMADRLAHRASIPQTPWNETAVAAHLEVVAQYGIVMRSFERNGMMQVCYDGDMFRHVLAMQADADQDARAALALTRNECVDPGLSPIEHYRFDLWRAQVLDRPKLEELSEQSRNRLHLRRAGVWSAVAFAQARRGEAPQAAAARALRELATTNKTELSDEDRTDYNDAAVRVGSIRWAIEPVLNRPGKLTVATLAGAPGETCVLLQDAQHDIQHPLFKRCTFAIVWNASAASNPAGTALTLAVQPLDTWRELWLFRQTSAGWTVDVIPPGTGVVDLGYIEFAGWIPGTNRMLTARELRTEGQFRRRFEIVSLDTLLAEKQAPAPRLLPLFYRWQDPIWRHQTVALR